MAMLSAVTRTSPVLKAVIDVASNIICRGFVKRFPVVCTGYMFEGYVAACTVKYTNKTNKRIFRASTARFSSEAHPTYSPELELDTVQFERITEDTLESLTEYFDELVEQAAHLQDADVNYGDGVLTVNFGAHFGTYVINRQTPNKQIWLSSPKSGPKRYDFIDGKWVYRHDGKTLHDLLNKEIPAIIRNQATFDRCSYSGMEQYHNLTKVIPE